MKKWFLVSLFLLPFLNTLQAETAAPSLEAILVETVEDSRGPIATYKFKAQGVETNRYYRIVSANLVQDLYRTSEEQVTFNSGELVSKEVCEAGFQVYIDDRGQVNSDANESEFLSFLGGLYFGEPIDVGLFNLNKELVARCQIVAFPIEVHDDKGHSIEAIHFSTTGDLLEIRLAGYSEGEKLKIITTSEGEKIEGECEFHSANKHTYAPAVIGKDGGSATYRVIGSDSDLTLHIDWGKKWAKAS